MTNRLLITDLDNTLYNFIDYFAPSFRGMVHALAKNINIPEDELIQQFKKVFANHGSLEHGFAVQELSCVQDKSYEEILGLIKIAKGAYSRVRQKNLEPYPNVKETLSWISQQGIIVIGVSNAPYFHALRRLRQLQIEKYFSGLVAWEGVPFNIDKYSKEIIEKEISGVYKSKIKKVWKLPKDKLKPNTDGYLMVMKEFAVRNSDCYILGDSISKDVRPAELIGAHGIWARYGEAVVQKNLETVLSISNWDSKKKETIYFEKHEEPERIINDFSELKNILAATQLTLF